MLENELLNQLVNELELTLKQKDKTASKKNHEALTLVHRFRNNTNLFMQAG